MKLVIDKNDCQAYMFEDTTWNILTDRVTEYLDKGYYIYNNPFRNTYCWRYNPRSDYFEWAYRYIQIHLDKEQGLYVAAAFKLPIIDIIDNSTEIIIQLPNTYYQGKEEKELKDKIIIWTAHK